MSSTEIVWVFFSSEEDEDEYEEATYYVKGMKCKTDVEEIQNKLADDFDILDAEVNLAGWIRITHTREVDSKLFVETLNDLGYETKQIYTDIKVFVV